MLIAIVWISLACVVYVYMGYPVLIYLLARVFGRAQNPPPLADAALPMVTLLIAAYNEQEVIGQRLANALAMDYPAARLEILIASDGSSDNTAAIVQTYAARGVRLLDYPMRRGKSSVLNAAMQEARGSIVVLSDANTNLAATAIRCLVRWFTDERIGVVCGRLVLTDAVSGQNADGAYWRYETFLKLQEAQLGALLGSNGAIYAMRQNLFQPIPPNTIVDDFVIPLLARLRTGCRIAYDKDAAAYEETAPDVSSEFRRRCRIGTGGFQAIALLWPLLNPRQGWLALAFLSHKILRWFCPFAMLAMLIANVPLWKHPIYRLLLLAQLLLYGVAWLGAVCPPGKGVIGRVVRLCSLFVSVNAALAVGFVRWVRGVRSGTWTTTRRVNFSADVSA